MGLNVQAVKDFLKTELFGREIIYYDEIDSTNNAAKEMAVDGEDHGILIVADKQTAGRGTQGRKWDSPSGVGVWMSLILTVDLDIKDAVKLPALVSLGVQKALKESTGLDVGVKWPNDIILNKKKICGILVESLVEGEKIKSLIVGIGINVNQEEHFFEGLENASSLFAQSGKTYIREEIICNILFYFEKCYNEFMKTKALDVDEIKKASVLLDKKVSVSYSGENFIGEVIGFREDGSIEILKESGEKLTIPSGNATIRGINNYLD